MSADNIAGVWNTISSIGTSPETETAAGSEQGIGTSSVNSDIIDASNIQPTDNGTASQPGMDIWSGTISGTLTITSTGFGESSGMEGTDALGIPFTGTSSAPSSTVSSVVLVTGSEISSTESTTSSESSTAAPVNFGTIQSFATSTGTPADSDMFPVNPDEVQETLASVDSSTGMSASGTLQGSVSLQGTQEGSITSPGLIIDSGSSPATQELSNSSSGTLLDSDAYPGIIPTSSSFPGFLPDNNLQSGVSSFASETSVMGDTGSNILETPVPPSVLIVDNNLPAFGIIDGIYVPTLGTVPGIDLSGLLPPDGTSQELLTTAGAPNLSVTTEGPETSSGLIFSVGQTDSSTMSSDTLVMGSGGTVTNGDSSVSGSGSTTEGSDIILSGSSSQTLGSDEAVYNTTLPNLVSEGTNSDNSSPTAGSDGTSLSGDSTTADSIGTGPSIGSSAEVSDGSGSSSPTDVIDEMVSTGASLGSEGSASSIGSSAVTSGENMFNSSLSDMSSLSIGSSALESGGAFSGGQDSVLEQISGISTVSQQSNGGTMSTLEASELPAFVVISGIGGQSDPSASVIGLPANSASIELSTLSPPGPEAPASSSMSSIVIFTQPGSSLIISGNITGILTGVIVETNNNQQPGSVSIVGNFVGTISAIWIQNGTGSMPVTGSFSGTFTADEAINLPTSGTMS